MAAITISRQMGSLGCQVAEETARRLGYKLVWREIINQSALRAGVPEVALATIDELDLLGLRPSRADQQAYHRAVRHYLGELAEEGNVVIVGRAGQVILKDQPGVLHVRIIASEEIRISRTASEKSVSVDKARVIVEKSDESRARYLRRNYHAELDDPSLYDLVINTDRLLVPEAADLICAAIERIQPTRKL
jgi:cytidylate kinase